MGLFHTVGTHKVPKKDLPVPVLAEPTNGRLSPLGDEARDEQGVMSPATGSSQTSRGGQNLSKEKARKKRWRDKHGAEYMKMYRAAQKLLKAREKGSIK